MSNEVFKYKSDVEDFGVCLILSSIGKMNIFKTREAKYIVKTKSHFGKSIFQIQN
jgi:hypothetical protein